MPGAAAPSKLPGKLPVIQSSQFVLHNVTFLRFLQLVAEHHITHLATTIIEHK